MIGAVLDHTAVRKAHGVLGGFYVEASRGGFALYVPALSLFGADADEAGAVVFVRGARSVTVVPFDLDAAGACAALTRAGVDWRGSARCACGQAVGGQHGRVDGADIGAGPVCPDRGQCAAP